MRQPSLKCKKHRLVLDHESHHEESHIFTHRKDGQKCEPIEGSEQFYCLVTHREQIKRLKAENKELREANANLITKLRYLP